MKKMTIFELMNSKSFLLPALLCLCISCGRTVSQTSWTGEELAVIGQEGSLMRVLTIDTQEDSLFLRKQCSDFTEADVLCDTFTSLAEKMIATVTSPEQDGVGIAGPQVGIARRVVAVQRFDKEGEPFEIYPNIRITAFRGDKEPGGEGCLSVPGKRGEVLRWQDIDIAYTSPATGKDTVESVQGFSAVIFQHETDHLEGVLYIDKAESIEADL